MMNEYEYYHIGYVVLHRNKIWLSECSTSKHLFSILDINSVIHILIDLIQVFRYLNQKVGMDVL